jgi:hypothetical protein
MGGHAAMDHTFNEAWQGMHASMIDAYLQWDLMGPPLVAEESQVIYQVPILVYELFSEWPQ